MRTRFVHVLCDHCKANFGPNYIKESIIDITNAPYGYEDEYVDAELVNQGWMIDWDRDICPDCAEGGG